MPGPLEMAVSWHKSSQHTELWLHSSTFIEAQWSRAKVCELIRVVTKFFMFWTIFLCDMLVFLVLFQNRFCDSFDLICGKFIFFAGISIFLLTFQFFGWHFNLFCGDLIYLLMKQFFCWSIIHFCAKSFFLLVIYFFGVESIFFDDKSFIFVMKASFLMMG